MTAEQKTATKNTQIQISVRTEKEPGRRRAKRWRERERKALKIVKIVAALLAAFSRNYRRSVEIAKLRRRLLSWRLLLWRFLRLLLLWRLLCVWRLFRLRRLLRSRRRRQRWRRFVARRRRSDPRSLYLDDRRCFEAENERKNCHVQQHETATPLTLEIVSACGSTAAEGAANPIAAAAATAAAAAVATATAMAAATTTLRHLRLSAMTRLAVETRRSVRRLPHSFSSRLRCQQKFSAQQRASQC